MFLWQYYPPLYLLAILSAALILDMIIGDPEWLYKRIPHPTAVIGTFLSFGEKLLNKERRYILRACLGGLWLAMTLSLFTWAAFMVIRLQNFIDLRFVIEVIITQSLLAQKSLYLHVKDVAVALSAEDVPQARRALRKLVSRDVARLNKSAIGRAAVESLSENFSDAVIAPVFWFLLAGLPGIVFYKAVNTADSMWGYRTPRYEAFGKLAARLDDVVNYFPARFSLLPILTAAALLPRTSLKEACRITYRYAHLHNSPNAGYPEAAFAGACRLALGGTRHYPGIGIVGTWIGDGKKQLTAQDIERALTLYKGSVFVLLLMLLSALTLWVLW